MTKEDLKKFKKMRNKGKYAALVYNKFMWREKDLHITLPKLFVI